MDVPPDDAINQMHRYRDALYYDPKQEGLPIKKEVLGGYILSREMERMRMWKMPTFIVPLKK